MSTDRELQQDLEAIGSLDGLYVGMLTLPEMEAFGRLRRAGLAEVEYLGAGGWLGLGKLKIVRAAASMAPQVHEPNENW